MSEDWLDTGKRDPDEVVHSVLLDSTSPRNRNLTPVEGLPERHRELVLALRKLSGHQRAWIRAYLESGCSRSGAVRILKARKERVMDVSCVTRWQHNLDYMTALNLLKAHYASMAGVDKDSILIKTGQVLEDAMTPKPILHMGEPTGFEEINGSVAMRAIEFAGKVNKMINDESGAPRVTLVVNIANRDDLETVQPVATQ